jgi:hypothetical protein
MPEPLSKVRTGRGRTATSRWSTPPAQPTQNSGTSGLVYRPRRPTSTPLYAVVQHHLETFLATAEDEDPRGWGMPSWVERDFRAYLRCGILAHGFARIRCDSCGHERLLAFSCKGRGVCPSCNTHRMAEVAAHLTDRVMPWLPVRGHRFREQVVGCSRCRNGCDPTFIAIRRWQAAF